MCAASGSRLRPFKHLLGGYILAAIEFDYSSVVKRIGIARKHVLGAQTSLSDC